MIGLLAYAIHWQTLHQQRNNAAQPRIKHHRTQDNQTNILISCLKCYRIATTQISHVVVGDPYWDVNYGQHTRSQPVLVQRCKFWASVCVCPFKRVNMFVTLNLGTVFISFLNNPLWFHFCILISLHSVCGFWMFFLISFHVWWFFLKLFLYFSCFFDFDNFLNDVCYFFHLCWYLLWCFFGICFVF